MEETKNMTTNILHKMFLGHANVRQRADNSVCYVDLANAAAVSESKPKSHKY